MHETVIFTNLLINDLVQNLGNTQVKTVKNENIEIVILRIVTNKNAGVLSTLFSN